MCSSIGIQVQKPTQLGTGSRYAPPLVRAHCGYQCERIVVCNAGLSVPHPLHPLTQTGSTVNRGPSNGHVPKPALHCTKPITGAPLKSLLHEDRGKHTSTLENQPLPSLDRVTVGTRMSAPVLRIFPYATPGPAAGSRGRKPVLALPTRFPEWQDRPKEG